MKVKDGKKLNKYKYQDLAGELKKIWNLKVVVEPIKVHALEIVPKNEEKRQIELEIRERIESI